MIDAIWSVWLELAPWLLLGTVVSIVLHVLFPRDFMRRQFTGPSGVLKAVAFGVPLPLCSCGVIPTGLGLKEDGASDGAAVGFLISTPQTGVDSMLVSASFLGWPFAIFKVGAAALTGIVGGLWADRAAPEPDASAPTAMTEGRPRTWRDGWAHGELLLGTIWGWVVFGVVASAAITVFVPPESFAALTAYGGWVPFVGALLVSVPLYVCATASVPIAAALVAAGMPTGAALVFLMAGPATNVATIGAVRRVFGGRVLVVYLTTIVVGSAALGWLYDVLLGSSGFATAAAMHHHTAWWAIASGVVLAVLFAGLAYQSARRMVSRLRPAPAASELVLTVDGMRCGGCARKVESALIGVDGVQGVEVVVDGGRAIVRGEAPAGALIAALERAGYDARA